MNVDEDTEPVLICFEIYAGVKELERRRVDGSVSLGLRRYEAPICVDSPPSHFFNTSRHTLVNIYIYIQTHIYILAWFRKDVKACSPLLM